MIRTNLKFTVISMVIISFALSGVILAQATSPVVGIWQGFLSLGQAKIRLVVKITEKDGNLTATLDSPDQGAKDIPINETLFAHDSLTLNLNDLMASYHGVLAPEKDTLRGEWKQGGMTFPLNLGKTDKLVEPELKRPQEPKPPYPYKEEEVSFQNKVAGITLAGTLTMPDSGGAFPAIVTITGSGPENRDEEIFGHKPFKVIADYLTRRGIAVLRCDDRGVGKSTGNSSGATSVDFASDTKAAVEYLRTRKEIDQKRIGLLGHSEGGIIAPMVAVDDKSIAFIVLLAPPGVPGDQIIGAQEELISRAAGMPEDLVTLAARVERRVLAVAKNVTDTIAGKQILLDSLKEIRKSVDSTKWGVVGLDDDALPTAAKTLFSPWFHYFITYDPAPALRKLKCPVLAMIGSNDLQVPASLNIPALQSALKQGNKSNEVVTLEGLNHLFQTAGTGAPSEYMKIEETISPAALEKIGNWLANVLKH